MLQNGITAAHGPRSLAEAPAPAADRPTDALPSRSAPAGCPNLPQRPRSNRSAREKPLIFRASSHRRSRPGAPLWQIWTHPAPNHPTNPTSTTQNLDTPRITFTARVGQSQCTYRCVVLPDSPRRPWPPRRHHLNAPTGAWCSLTRRDAQRLGRKRGVSMHLQVRGAP